ncbi:MAG: ribonuclease P protein component [Candidatus Eisenbacteria bacterium]|nr:ribonuclease P protein component [Candidatus Eisenbacteria bacterium]
MYEQGKRQKLRKPERIRKKRDFTRIFQDPKIARGENFRVYYLERDDLPSLYPVRGAFVAGKKVGNSVTRNRIKRLLREAFRKVKGDLKARAGLDLVFVANRDFAGSGSREIEEEMRGVLARAGFLPTDTESRGDGACDRP